MATLAQLRTRIDTFLADKWPAFTNRQSVFRSTHGRYWQGLITHTIIPAHTASADGDTLSDQVAAHPTDQPQGWAAAFPEFETDVIPCALRCDAYNGPLGDGYVATLFVRYNGVLYARSQNVGPLTDRTSGWRQVNN